MKLRTTLASIAVAWTILAVAVFSARFLYTGSLRFYFLIWNLALAWIPLLCAFAILISQKSWWRILCLTFWFAFLPNSFYLLTDFVHLYQTEVIGIWYDILLISVFAFNGYLLGYASLFLIEKSLFQSTKRVHIFNAVVIFLSAFGVYIGRFWRWNSWDVIAQPLDLLRDIVAVPLYPIYNLRAIAFTLLFGAVTWLGYYSLRALALYQRKNIV
jgi:uncharacterized membrane protein